jgi:16S rRNA processing protein RimM
MGPPKKSSGPLLPVSLPGRGTQESEVELAAVVGVFGVQGEVRLHLHNRESDWLRLWRDVVLVAPDGARYPARLRARSGAGNRVIGQIEGLTDRTVAFALTGCKVAAPARALPPLPDDEAYVWQIVGLPVFSAGRRVGSVAEVHTNCPTPILEIALEGAAEPSFVPLLPDQATVDVAAQRVDLSAGALEEP